MDHTNEIGTKLCSIEKAKIMIKLQWLQIYLVGNLNLELMNKYVGYLIILSYFDTIHRITVLV